MSSPTSRTLELLRDQGCVAQVVEYWVPHSRTRRDLFGFIDIVALHPDLGTIGVQATSTGNVNARIKKILEIPEATLWLRAGNKILVAGWKRYKKPVDRKYWRPTLKEITLDDFDGEIHQTVVKPTYS